MNKPSTSLVDQQIHDTDRHGAKSKTFRAADGAPKARAEKPPKTPQTTRAATHPMLPAPTSGSPTAGRAPMSFTQITGLVPDRLTKIIGLKPDGSMRKEASAHLSKGVAQRIRVRGLTALRDHLDSLTSAQAVIWGTTSNELAGICADSDSAAKETGAIARTRQNFNFVQEPGIMMFDHDGLPNAALTADEFRARVIAAAPDLSGAPMLCRPSASAGCQHADGRVLTPLHRQRRR